MHDALSLLTSLAWESVRPRDRLYSWKQLLFFNPVFHSSSFHTNRG